MRASSYDESVSETLLLLIFHSVAEDADRVAVFLRDRPAELTAAMPPVSDAGRDGMPIVLSVGRLTIITQQTARRDAGEVLGVHVAEALHVDAVLPFEEIVRRHVARRRRPDGGHDLGARVDRGGVVVPHADRLGVDVEARGEARVLRRDAGRAAIRVALERLDAAEGEHHGARGVAEVGAQREGLGHREAVDDLAGRDERDAVAETRADQKIVRQAQTFRKRHADRVLKLGRRGARAAFGAVDRDEVGDHGVVVRLEHRVDQRRELLGFADAQFDADGLRAAGQLAQHRDEVEETPRRRKGRMPRRRQHVVMQVIALKLARLGYRRRYLRSRQNAAVRGFGALRELELHKFDLGSPRILGKLVGREHAAPRGGVAFAAREVSRADVPAHVRATQVVRRDAALARVVVAPREPGAVVERGHRVLGERAERHGRDVEQTRRIGRSSRRVTADRDPRRDVVGRRERPHRVVRPLVALGIHIAARAEADGVADVFRASIHHGTFRPRVRHAAFLLGAFDEILLDLGPDALQKIPHVHEEREIAPESRAAP
mmetsp:Transcript_8676/g.35726  ORF Transcript_8676/g.35726 Transcript_8676/m.35726 type:complete len:547 (-) Transcript_8676:391-2031(-)